MVDRTQLNAPLAFTPVYQTVVWGGRRMEAWRDDLPEGPIGESWEISQQARGMSVVESGDLAGTTLAQLVEDLGPDLVGECYDGGDFPLLIKLIDANARLSVQVHPDDELAVRFDRGRRGKTECWFILGDGGELFQGTKDGVNAETFRQAIVDDSVEACLNRFETSDGEFYFLPARTVHALGDDTLLFEIQQSSDCTFRVYDWGRVGLDGQPRELHVEESMATIDFADQSWGPVQAAFESYPGGGEVRRLVECEHFEVEERRGTQTMGMSNNRCWIVIVLEGEGELGTAGGTLPAREKRSYLVPACAGAWTFSSPSDARLLVAQPR